MWFSHICWDVVIFERLTLIKWEICLDTLLKLRKRDNVGWPQMKPRGYRGKLLRKQPDNRHWCGELKQKLNDNAKLELLKKQDRGGQYRNELKRSNEQMRSGA